MELKTRIAFRHTHCIVLSNEPNCENDEEDIGHKEIYLKSEADKVIAELKDKLDLYKRGWEENDKINANLYAQLRHRKYKRCLAMASKYKRCLAMARMCEATALWCYQAANTLPTGFSATLFGKPVMIEPHRLYNRFELLNKWHKRWMELAEKFKETKR